MHSILLLWPGRCVIQSMPLVCWVSGETQHRSCLAGINWASGTCIRPTWSRSGRGVPTEVETWSRGLLCIPTYNVLLCCTFDIQTETMCWSPLQYQLLYT